jgi:hypothetical protein
MAFAVRVFLVDQPTQMYKDVYYVTPSAYVTTPADRLRLDCRCLCDATNISLPPAAGRPTGASKYTFLHQSSEVYRPRGTKYL